MNVTGLDDSHVLPVKIFDSPVFERLTVVVSNKKGRTPETNPRDPLSEILPLNVRSLNNLLRVTYLPTLSPSSILPVPSPSKS